MEIETISFEEQYENLLRFVLNEDETSAKEVINGCIPLKRYLEKNGFIEPESGEIDYEAIKRDYRGILQWTCSSIQGKLELII